MANAEKTIAKRILPLYAAVFLQSFVLWYAIEKLFMVSIGFDGSSIGMMVAAYSLVMLLAETPSGILADRWSRKGVLILGSLALAVSGIVGGISHSVVAYIIAAGCWGVFFALYSGTYDSVVYDLVLEEDDNSKLYERFFGRLRVFDSAGLVISSLVGGVVAAKWGLRSAYFLTTPFALGSIVPLVIFAEPKLHKSHLGDSIKAHVVDTFREVLKKRSLLYIVIALAGLQVIEFTIFEFDQLWLIALSVPVVMYGPVNGLLLSMLGIGGLAADKLKMSRPKILILTAFAMLVGGLVLVFSKTASFTVIAMTIVAFGFLTISIVFSRFMHDDLPSRVRAGSSSAVSTIGRLVLIPTGLLFGVVSQRRSVFAASWIVVILALVILAAVIKALSERHNKSVAITADDDMQLEPHK